MGEYAEMLLDGTCCQYCGEFIGDEIGFPRACPSCEAEAKELRSRMECPICNKLVKKNGLQDHMRDKHPTKEES